MILTGGKRRRIFQKGILKRPGRTDTIVTDYEELEEQLFVGEIGQQNVRVSPRLPCVHLLFTVMYLVADRRKHDRWSHRRFYLTWLVN